jgi:hypothetical protein
MTTSMAVQVSGYHPVHIRRLLLSGRVKGQKWGQEWQISRSSLLAYLEGIERAGKRRGPKPRRKS